MGIIENDLVDYLNEIVIIANNVTILSRKTMTTSTDEIDVEAGVQAKMAAARSNKIKQCIQDLQDIIDNKQERMTKQESRGNRNR